MTATRQSFAPGSTVRVGFLTLTVKAALPRSEFILSNAAGTQLYHSIPFNGCEKIGPPTRKP